MNFVPAGSNIRKLVNEKISAARMGRALSKIKPNNQGERNTRPIQDSRWMRFDLTIFCVTIAPVTFSIAINSPKDPPLPCPPAYSESVRSPYQDASVDAHNRDHRFSP